MKLVTTVDLFFVFYITLTLKTFIWLDHLGVFFFFFFSSRLKPSPFPIQREGGGWGRGEGGGRKTDVVRRRKPHLADEGMKGKSVSRKSVHTLMIASLASASISRPVLITIV